MALRHVPRQAVSPTANLLRNSRLFSLPKPLPSPSVAETVSSGTVKSSDTATLPYPTYQAIANTPSSLSRGDWGLKRPLPSRSRLVQTSNPVVRVSHLDTIEQITDFDSAADHVRTVEKWGALHAPMLRRETGQLDPTVPTSKSAFEPEGDMTAYETEGSLDEAGRSLKAIRDAIQRNKKEGEWKPFVPARPMPPTLNRRWKHEGPWLPGMSAEEFVQFVEKQLSSPELRKEFNTYLVEYVKSEIYARRKVAFKDPLPLDEAEADAVLHEKEAEWSSFTEADIQAGIRALRAECIANPLESRLVTKLIVPFLRLPPMKTKSAKFSSEVGATNPDGLKFDDDSRPSSTHPSGGLGYLRTKSYLNNHPLLGPQEHKTPTAARIVQPRTTATSKERTAKLGIAGFIANDEHMHSRTNIRDPTETMDVDAPGGAKLTVEALHASLTPDGRVMVKTARRNGPEVAVARGELDEVPPLRPLRTSRQETMNFRSLGRSGIRQLDALSDEAPDARAGREQTGISAKERAMREDLFGALNRMSRVEGGENK